MPALIFVGVIFSVFSIEACHAQKTAPQRITSTPLRPGSTPQIIQRQSNTRQSAIFKGSAEQTAPIVSAAELPVQYDSGVDRLGGRLYSTGRQNVLVTILNPSSQRAPMTGRHEGSPLNSEIYLINQGREIFIGKSKQAGKVVNLGKLPQGELVFAIKTIDQVMLRSGDGAKNPDSKNPDKLLHAFTRTFNSGAIQILFEDELGPKNKPGLSRMAPSDRDFDDVVIQLSGDVVTAGVSGVPLSELDQER